MFRLPLLISVLMLLSSCGGSHPASGPAAAPPAEPDSARTEVSDLTRRAGEVADSILATMTLESKVAQVFMPAVYAASDPYTLKVVGDYGRMGVGGIVLLKGNSESAAMLADTLSRSGAIPPFVAIDAEWGLGMRLIDEPRYPSNSEVGRHADESLMFEYGETVAAESRKIGINMILGPVMDLASTGSFMAKRSYGSDPVRVADLAVAYARGLESGGVMSVAKHFPGHGSAGVDSHRRKAVIARSLHDLDSLDLYPFRKYIEQGLGAVMVGHLAVPAVDPEMMPAAVSKAVIRDLLRVDLGFGGLVLTDAMNMGGAEGNGADLAVEAGADIVLVPADTRAEMRRLRGAVESGEVSDSLLSDRVRRILFHKALLMKL